MYIRIHKQIMQSNPVDPSHSTNNLLDPAPVCPEQGVLFAAGKNVSPQFHVPVDAGIHQWTEWKWMQ